MLASDVATGEARTKKARRASGAVRGRDREQTELDLVAAVGQVLARDGFRAIGVNPIARAAGVDKVLIYRYFGDLDGLVRAYAEQGDFWPTIEELTSAPDNFETLDAPGKLAAVFRNLALGLRRRPETLEILAWEMVERNQLTAHLEALREAHGLGLLSRFGPELSASFGAADLQAITALFAAATNYLATRARLIRVFNGIEIREEAAWARLGDAMEAMVRGLSI